MKMPHRSSVCLVSFVLCSYFLRQQLAAQETEACPLPKSILTELSRFGLVRLPRRRWNFDSKMRPARSRALTKDDNGLWSLTTAAMPPDIYSYTFTVDGSGSSIPMSTSSCPTTSDRVACSPCPDRRPSRGKRPTFRTEWCTTIPTHPRSSATAAIFSSTRRRVSKRKGRPSIRCLYLLHGYSDFANAWTVMGHANFILDNLIAQGKAKPMIVVMPLGYGAPKLLEHGWKNLGTMSCGEQNIERFADALLTEVIPQVEQRVSGDQRSRRAGRLPGLSMGGARNPVHRAESSRSICLDGTL